MFYSYVKILPEIQIAVNTAQPDATVMWSAAILKTIHKYSSLFVENLRDSERV